MKTVKNNMRFKVVEITPEEASRFLEKNHPNNRRAKEGKIELYARDISSGLWKLTHQAIAFDEDGRLVDGQNRLSAIVLANKPAEVTLCFGVPRLSMLGVDCGTNRNVADAAKISGDPLQYVGLGSVARRMQAGSRKQFVTIGATLAFIKKHRDALLFAFEVLPKNTRGISHSAIRGVIARAWYRRNSRTRIKEFAQMLFTGIATNLKTDSAAIRMRNYLLDAAGRRSGRMHSYEGVWTRMEAALDAFLRHENLDKLYRAKEELFPIPGEKTFTEEE